MSDSEEHPVNEEAEQERLLKHEDSLRDRVLGLQERFGYFFLAASGSAIAFALTQSKDEPAACWMILALLAIVAWGVSFMLSAHHLLLKVKALLGDWKTVRIRLNMDPTVEANPDLREPALARLYSDMMSNDKKSGQLARWAFWSFLLGGVLYLVAQIQRIVCAVC